MRCRPTWASWFCAWPSVETTAAWIAAAGMLDIFSAKAGAAPAPSAAASAAAVATLDSFIISPLLFSFMHVANTFDLVYWLFYPINNQRDWNRNCSRRSGSAYKYKAETSRPYQLLPDRLFAGEPAKHRTHYPGRLRLAFIGPGALLRDSDETEFCRTGFHLVHSEPVRPLLPPQNPTHLSSLLLAIP